jgi:hypothetical protein
MVSDAYALTKGINQLKNTSAAGNLERTSLSEKSDAYSLKPAKISDA